MTFGTLFADGTGPVPAAGHHVGLLPMWRIWVILAILALLGLRDKVIFLAARGEVYATLTVTFLFGGVDMIVAAKLVFLVIWMGAATSKLNKHFPFVMSTMMSNNPLFRPRFIKRMFFEKFPDDLRPGRLSRIFAHVSTFVEMCVPIVLFFAHGGWWTAVAAAIMVVFHLGILTAIPMGVPLEWNVFMIFGVLSLFVGHAKLGLTDLKNPVPVAILIAFVAGIVIAGNLFPRKISFLPGMRYYAGNWDTTLWCIKPSADKKINHNIVSIASMPRGPAGAVLRQGAGADPDVPRICVPRHEHSRQGAVHPGASGDGRPERGRLRPHRRGTHLQHRHRMEFRRRPHAQRAADRRDAAALPLRARRGARRAT